MEWPSRVEENFLLAARLKRIYKNNQAECYALPTFNHGTVVMPGIMMINDALLKKNKK